MKNFDFMEYLTPMHMHRYSDECGEFGELLKALGNPEKAFKIISVTGTNGKGSCCAYLEQILLQGGYQVGLFNSPALVYINERMRINAKQVKSSIIENAALKVHDAEESTKISLGATERLIAVSLMVFSQSKVDYAIIEVPSESRSFCVESLPSIAAIITPIDTEYVQELDEFDEVCNDKCAIIKPDLKFIVTYGQRSEALDIILQHCCNHDVSLHDNAHCSIMFDRFENMRQYFTLTLKDGISFELDTALLGEHQVQNACACAMFAYNLGLRAEVIESGISRTIWPGRMEMLCGDPDVLLDGAHNSLSANALVNSLNEYFPNKRILMICSIMKLRDLEGILSRFADRVSDLIAVPLGDKSYETEVIAEVARNYGINASVSPSFQKAFVESIIFSEDHIDDDVLVVVAGSLYLVGRFREFLLDDYMS